MHCNINPHLRNGRPDILPCFEKHPQKPTASFCNTKKDLRERRSLLRSACHRSTVEAFRIVAPMKKTIPTRCVQTCMGWLVSIRKPTVVVLHIYISISCYQRLILTHNGAVGIAAAHANAHARLCRLCFFPSRSYYSPCTT